jgi:hypothetical protein
MADEAPQVKARPGDLHRRQMADGGEVVSGPLAAEALDAVGARAMTVDRTIFVNEDFDPTEAEDQALYAHERLHQLHSGGERTHGGKDAEESAARAVEAMVLHRRSSGEDFGQIMRDVNEGRTEDRAEKASAPESSGGDTHQDVMQAYRTFRNRGYAHETIVRMLADGILKEIRAGDQEARERSPVGPKNVGNR